MRQNQEMLNSLIFYCDSIIILMHTFPHKKRDLVVQLQKQESYTQGCCFNAFRFAENNSYAGGEKRRVFSQPKTSKTQKIDLTIGKRRLSQTKKEQQRQGTQSRQRFPPNVQDLNKEHQHSKVALTIGSKITTQRSSLRTSKVSFNKDLKLQCQIKQEKKSWITTNNTLKQHYQQPSTSRQDFSWLTFISQISLIEQQFVSQGSESLKTLNFISQMQSPSTNNISPGMMLPLQLSRISQQNQSRILMNKMIDFKKEISGSGRKRLLL